MSKLQQDWSTCTYREPTNPYTVHMVLYIHLYVHLYHIEYCFTYSTIDTVYNRVILKETLMS